MSEDDRDREFIALQAADSINRIVANGLLGAQDVELVSRIIARAIQAREAQIECRCKAKGGAGK